MKEPYREQLKEGMFLSGLIAGGILAAVLALTQLLFWLIEGRVVDGVVIRTRGMSTCVCVIMSFVILIGMVSYKLSMRAGFLNTFYVDRSILYEVKIRTMLWNAIYLGCITTVFQIIYYTGKKDALLILFMQLFINILLLIALILWVDNFAMYATWAELLYMSAICFLIVKSFVLHKTESTFLIIDTMKAIIWMICLLIAVVTGIVWNQKLTKVEDLIKGGGMSE